MKLFFSIVFSFIILLSSGSPVLAVSTWTNQGNLATGQYRHEAVILDDGKVFIAGGYFSTTITNLHNFIQTVLEVPEVGWQRLE